MRRRRKLQAQALEARPSLDGERGEEHERLAVLHYHGRDVVARWRPRRLWYVISSGLAERHSPDRACRRGRRRLRLRQANRGPRLGLWYPQVKDHHRRQWCPLSVLVIDGVRWSEDEKRR